MKESQRWPALPLAEWKDTYATLHMWTQIVGKIRLALGPPINHFWGTTFYVTARGLTTSAMPYHKGTVEINFDFIAHALEIVTSLGETRSFRLVPRTVAQFYFELMSALHSLGIDAKVWTMPVEVPRPVRFNQDEAHSSYDSEYAHRFWQVLVSVDTVLRKFRSRFIGKASPVHFFWGSFDLAATRFSGRRAPERPDADFITEEAYSHEVISHGFWPGDGAVIKDAAFYAYAAPEPAGFKDQRVMPSKAFYSGEKNEFFLMYDDVRLAHSPEQALLEFCQSTYEAGANLGHWDRASLEKSASSTHV
ncbi:MAG TPA: DUF5996 family protein [Candidatus Acidoferrales bacterium]|jgi:Family of unknown function (DUF5996)|nr:DUF5996 family protein [Candidatus Acidoferrales bacterium]